MALGLDEHEFAADSLDRLADPKAAAFQINVGPREACCLTQPQSGCEGQDVEAAKAVAGDPAHEGGGLLWCKDRSLGLANAGGRRKGSSVASYKSPSERPVQGSTQHGPNMVNRAR